MSGKRSGQFGTRSPHEQTSLDEWQRIIHQGDWGQLPDLLAEDVTYHTPADAMPLRGKDAIVDSLRLSFDALETFEYSRRFSGDEGFVLEFRGSIGDASFTGIDIIRLDASGKITDLVVMMRPIAAIMKLGEKING
ncbi:nuclear transport factor 2 family protein [Maricaulaceae bacterium MS644]